MENRDRRQHNECHINPMAPCTRFHGYDFVIKMHFYYENKLHSFRCLFFIYLFLFFFLYSFVWIVEVGEINPSNLYLNSHQKYYSANDERNEWSTETAGKTGKY